MIDWTKPIELDTVPPRAARVVEIDPADSEWPAFVEADWPDGASSRFCWVDPNGKPLMAAALSVLRRVRTPRVRNVIAQPAESPDFTCNRAHYQALLARISDGDALIAELVAVCQDALEVEEDMARCPDSELASRLRAVIAKATAA